MKIAVRILASILLLNLLVLSLLSCTPQLPAETDSQAPAESTTGTQAPEITISNLYDAASTMVGSFAADGSIVTEGDRRISTAIAVTAGETVYFGPCEDQSLLFLLLYREDGSVLRSVPKNALRLHSRFLSGHVIYAYTVPEGASAIRVSAPNAYHTVFTVAKEAFDSYDYFLFHRGAETGELFQSKNPSYPAYISSAFTDKRALFLGASICAAGRESSLAERGYCGRIAVATGISVTNRAMSGASFSTIKGENRILYQYQKVSDKNAYDYIILHSGVNDAWGTGGMSAPVGEVSDSYLIRSFDTTTYAGALEEMFATIQENSPSAKVGYILSHQSPHHDAESIRDTSAYHAVAKEICEKWGVPYLNMYEDAAFNRALENDTTNHLYDKLHPGTTGYDILYLPIMYWMESLATGGAGEAFPSDFCDYD